MQLDVEKQTWDRAWQVYGESLSAVLSQALAPYKRTAGLDDLSRVYPGTVGRQALVIWRQALMSRWPESNFGQSDLWGELRYRLRSHLTQYLLRRLVNEQVDTPLIRDALFGLDLGA